MIRASKQLRKSMLEHKRKHLFCWRSFGASSKNHLEEAGEAGAGMEGLEPGVPHGAVPLGNDIIVGNGRVLQSSLQLLSPCQPVHNHPHHHQPMTFQTKTVLGKNKVACRLTAHQQGKRLWKKAKPNAISFIACR